MEPSLAWRVILLEIDLPVNALLGAAEGLVRGWKASMDSVSLKPVCVGICNGSKLKSVRSTPSTTFSLAVVVLAALSRKAVIVTPVPMPALATGLAGLSDVT